MIYSKSPAGCWAMGRAPSPPYDVPRREHRQRVPSGVRQAEPGHNGEAGKVGAESFLAYHMQVKFQETMTIHLGG